MPESIKNAPQLTQGLELYYGAFFELTSCRASGFSEGPIPWTAIDSYCRSLNIEGELREGVFYHVRSLDNEYLSFVEERRKSQQKG